MPDIDRSELIALCEDAFVPEKYWHDRDSAGAVQQVGKALALLKAGCAYKVCYAPAGKEADRGCYSDANTWWIEITYRGFMAFEIGMEEGASRDTFYIPTRERLDKANGKDWY